MTSVDPIEIVAFRTWKVVGSPALLDMGTVWDPRFCMDSQSLGLEKRTRMSWVSEVLASGSWLLRLSTQ